MPPPWKDSARIRLSETTLAAPETLAAVRHALFTRTPVVYDMESSTRVPARGADVREVWSVPPDADFLAEATWRLARANAVDARDPTNPVWRPAAMAIAAGALPDVSLRADVVLPDGRSAWFDGGPLHLWDEADPSFNGVVVVPRVAIARGQLTPVAARAPKSTLAPDQLRAVADPSTRVRIIAPAGSGKTRVLVERARHMLEAGVPADSLMLVAFNKRAQEEMLHRTTDLRDLRIQTLNALALSILNGTNGFQGRGTRVRTIDEREVRTIISEYVKFPRKTNTDPAAAWVDALTEVRLGLRSPVEVERGFRGDVEGFADFFPQYRQHLADHHQVDFDEQIYLALEVLLREPEIRLASEKRAEVLLVDEFQDLTPAHMLLLRLLAGPNLSIFAVGDDDQTIYGYAGATPAWLVAFEDHVPDAVHHALEVNYRCPAPVISAASNLLSRNAVRVPKVIRPGPDNVRAPKSMAVDRVDDQVRCVTDHVQALLSGGAEHADIAVLSRVNANLVPVQVALIESGVPVNVRDDGQFLRSSGVDSALAWMRLAVRPERLSGNDIELAVRRPGRGISPKARGWMGEQDTLDGLRRLSRRLDDATSKKVAEFVHDLERATAFAARTTSSSLIEFIRSDIGLDRALETLDASHKGRNSPSNSDGLRSLIALGRQHVDPKTFDAWLRRTLSEPSDGRGVTLATVHRVKGLEWPHVVVYDVSDSVFPHRLSEDFEEERRVFHVAITRCTRSLLITADRASPSLFLDELVSAAPAAPTIERTSSEPRTSRSASGQNPVVAVVGLKFKWGGYDFTVRAVKSDGVMVSTGDSRTTTLPFGWTFKVNGETRTLVAPTAKPRRTEGPSDDVDPVLYTALKAWRLEQARADGVPAFVIFNDRTLDELCRVRPRTMRELLNVSGIGPAKADRYGDQILSLIDE